VRIGGIYALERVARDSADDHPTVMEVLTTFIREHSPIPLRQPMPDGLGPEQPPPRPDVQAAVTVVGRRHTARDIGLSINLTGANFNSANLTYANLTGAKLADADLADADLTYAKLTGAKLTSADLTGTNLPDTHITAANLLGADLTSAKWRTGEPAPEGWIAESGRLKRAGQLSEVMTLTSDNDKLGRGCPPHGRAPDRVDAATRAALSYWL
jgi:Pentapeptide repeats (8 copies)